MVKNIKILTIIFILIISELIFAYSNTTFATDDKNVSYVINREVTMKTDKTNKN